MTKKRVVSRTSYVDSSKVGQQRPAGTGRELQGQVEAQWKCSSCGTTGIPGRVKKCPNCGNPKGGDEVYQPPEPGARLLTQVELDEMGVDAEHSSDQTCPFCGYNCKPGTESCPNCSANLTDVARTSRQCPNCGHETNLVTCPQCGSQTERKEKDIVPQQSFSSSPSLPIDIGLNFEALKPFWWVPVAVAVLGLIALILWPRQTEVTVQSVSWKCEVFLQEYQYNQHEGWSLPAGADLINQDRRIHHYNKVVDHYTTECHAEQQQDGYDTETYEERVCGDVYDHTEETCYDDASCDREDVYRTECDYETRSRQVPRYKDVEVCEQVPVYRDEPVYADYYAYKVWEWVNIASEITTGSDFEPYWPTDFRIDNKHREAGRQPTFSVTLVSKDGKRTFTYAPSSFEEYRTFQIGTTWKITHSAGVVTKIEPIGK